LIYGDFPDKFLQDIKTNRTIINPKHSSYNILRQYSIFTKLITRYAELNSDLADLSLLHNFIEEIDLRCKIQAKIKESKLNPSMLPFVVKEQQEAFESLISHYTKQILQEGIKELTLTRPNQVQDLFRD